MLKGSDMTRRSQGGWEIVASMPWQIGIVLGLIAYIAIRHGIGWYLGSTGNPYLSGLGRMAAAGTYAPIAWILLIGCWGAAIVSFVSRARRHKLLDSQTGIDSLRQISWRQFEQLTGEAFRRQGYAIEETGLGGADGGIDLVLHKNGQTTLVQCKQWQHRQVGVKIVREMYGLLLHHQAAAVKIVALGDYTSDAQRFAQGKPIALIHGGELIATVRSLQKPKARATKPMNSLLALSGSMIASLLLIAALSSATANAPSPVAPPPPVAIQPAAQSIPASTRHSAATPPSQPQAVIYASNPQNDAQLRDWKKRNAESMKILEKTTKEMPLR
ncbi:MAG TPA: restriction endonuclease [Pirellulaceae bacterium]|nr:restriction endonuclease [Pirellulaceae bacterium]